MYFFPCITRVDPSILQLPLRSSNFLAFFKTGLRYCCSFSVSAQYSLSTNTPSGRCFLCCSSKSQSCLCANLIEIGLLLCSLYLPSLSVYSIGIFSTTSILSAIVLLLTVCEIMALTFLFLCNSLSSNVSSTPRITILFSSNLFSMSFN